MTATAAEALELALWLHRAPARRAALLGRPLPDGIALLLRVAGGAHDQVAAAATITGEDEATILEAVRFYLQQILFHDEADAWRVLGLRPGAPQSQAREHHRLLQQWLHPDRRGPDDWESVYATRVNRAWSDLKSGKPPQDADTVPSPRRSRFSGEHPILPPAKFPPRRSRSKTATLLVLLACIGLVIAIALQNDTPPEWRDPRAILVSAGPATTAPTATLADSEVPDGAALLATLDALALEASRQVEATGAAIAAPIATAVMEPVAALAAPASAAPAPPPRPPVAQAVPVSSLAVADSHNVSRPTAPSASVPTTPSAPAPKAVLLAAAAPVVVAPPPASPAPQPATIPDAYARMTQARERARMVSEYLGDLGATPPPVWNDLHTFHQAQAARAQLHQRLGQPKRVALQLQDPRWRLNAEGAWLQTAYQAAGEQGTLKIAFTWREDQLLVRSVVLDPDA